ncbi:MAG TPA: hypothetical protein VH062_14295 [Polyangiaceae bacterium]|nr:hypothetical protein [Polyangiaceae bacterium]
MKRRYAVTLLCAAIATSACSDAPVSRLTEHMVHAELERAARAGYPARVVLDGAPSAAVKAGEDETVLVLGAKSVHVVPSPAFAPFTSAGFEEWLVRVWVAPYLAVSDVDGAYRAAVRGYTHALEDQHVLSRGAPLPPLPSPNEWGFTFPSHNADWGLPLSFVVFALCFVVERFTRRT